MKPEKEHISKVDKEIQKVHQKDLGFNVPEDFFTKSKNDILAKSKPAMEDVSTILPLYKNKRIWLVAASIALLVSIFLLQPSRLQEIKDLPSVVADTLEQINQGLVNSSLETENDVLLSSLFVEDEEVEELVDAYMLGDLDEMDTEYN